MHDKRVVIVGAGPGGLTAGMILAHRGYRVSIYEKQGQPGGRNGSITLGSYKFDIGPTFLMMKYVLDEVFELAGKRIGDYLDAYPLDPMYRLSFTQASLDITSNHEVMRQRIAAAFPGEEQGFERFLRGEESRFARMKPCLEKPYSRFYTMFSKNMLRAIPYLGIGRSVHDMLSNYYAEETLRTCFCFQTKYLGMSPWECPGAFTMIPLIEHKYGIYHVRGGLSEISQAMTKAVLEEGGEIHYQAPVKQVLVKGRRAVGVELETGEKIDADIVIINADFAHAMTHLFAPGVLRKYTAETLRKKAYSCSTFMLYLGLDRLYPEPHHTIVFAEDYRRNIEDIALRKCLSENFSVYVRNASITDPTLAPAGKSAVYVLVPTPNNTSGIDWNACRQEMRQKTLDIIKKRTSMADIEKHIEAEHIITPGDWEANDVYLGATFNLAHTLNQMLYFRPHNAFEELAQCYLVGGGTHPGSGLPTIYESARITVNLISAQAGKNTA